MGFRPSPTVYNLSFQGTPLDGLHVRMGCCTLGEYDEMLRAAVMGFGEEDEEGNTKLTPEILAKNDRIIDLFSNYLLSWDLEDVLGNEVPTTREGINSQERTIIGQLISAWQSAMVNIPNQSKPESKDGGTSEEQSLGLGSISESPQN
jgi:hypothetical protein